MASTGEREIRAEAERYAVEEMGREARAVFVLDHGKYALAYLRATDGDEDFALELVAATATHEWSVIEETDAEDFVRNAKLDGLGDALARVLASALAEDAR